MVRPIIKDPIFLSSESAPASESDAATGNDLIDTLSAHKDECVGLAANMIGVHKRIIAIMYMGRPMLMYNPVIIKKSGEYETEEGCLSLSGTRKTVRYRQITVRFQTPAFKTVTMNFSDFPAQVIQHETDHCNGRLI